MDAVRLGLDALVVAAAYHSVRAFAPRLPSRRVVTVDAGAYFEPDPRLYGEIQPLKAAGPVSGDSLRRCVELAAEAGIRLRAWAVLTHSTSLGRRHADHTVENAFGDRYLHALCPSSPAVRAYAAGLVADIAERGMTSIDLEAFGSYGYAHGSHHDKPRHDLSPAAEALLSLCFCRWCTAAFGSADIDAERLRSATVKAADASVQEPDLGKGPLEALGALPDGERAVEMRAQATLELLAEVRAAVGIAVELHAIGTAAPLGLGDPMAAGDPRLRAHVDGVIVPAYGLAPEAVVGEIEAARAAIGVPVAVGLRIVAPDGGGTRLEHCVRAATDAGVASFRHYHFGLATAAELEALGHVVRNG
ncbi:MAG TPA: hypothetical protein VGM80_03120 [Gaiellaceae bacterium]|jgi:hypothetical protein